ncbi:uncharacterized protein DUF4303 [Rhodococcus sp. OK519]|uniref:DUF4303 domain-containing protein n=1 Tax=Rhodococcus sp. OK519 TaxID=2135729 RepID=UPI000D42D588|nr:uncharacterized protein DUF4303 [Rhodococcus sp. OK519]
MDWVRVEAAFRDRIVECVRRMCAEHPDDRIYGAALHEFYAESGGAIAWPMIGVAGEKALASVATADFGEDALRWSPADWPWQCDPDQADDALASEITAAATAGGDKTWERVHRRFERAAAKACRSARRILVEEGIVHRNFVAVAMDEAWELIPLSLSKAQLRRHFPELDEEQAAVDRLTDLPVANRIAELVAIVDAPVSPPPGAERAIAWLRDLGDAAVPAVLGRLSRAREKWQWAKLLGEIGDASNGVVDALEAVVAKPSLPVPDRAWAAAALARLGRMGVVIARIDGLPEEVAVRGLSAPYTSFRDVGVPTLLDYAPLEEALTAHPALHDPVCARLSPGSGYCVLATDEIEVAFGGLGSVWAAVRRHAVLVLSDVRLETFDRARYEVELDRLSADPDARVRDAVRVVVRTREARRSG